MPNPTNMRLVSPVKAWGAYVLVGPVFGSLLICFAFVFGMPLLIESSQKFSTSQPDYLGLAKMFILFGFFLGLIPAMIAATVNMLFLYGFHIGKLRYSPIRFGLAAGAISSLSAPLWWGSIPNMFTLGYLFFAGICMLASILSGLATNRLALRRVSDL